MTLRRTLPRVAGSLAALVVVASVPAWGLVGGTGAPPREPPQEATFPSFFDSAADTPSPLPSPSDAAPDDPAGPTSTGDADVGDDILITVSDSPFWIGPEGNRAEVIATVSAYRAARGLPPFVPYDPTLIPSCTWAAHGSAAAGGFERTSATLGQLLVSRSPEAVGFRPAPGTVAMAWFVVDELIVDGVVYPNRATQVIVDQCVTVPPPSDPSVPPVDPAPSDPPTPDPVPSDPPPSDPPVESPPPEPAA